MDGGQDGLAAWVIDSGAAALLALAAGASGLLLSGPGTALVAGIAALIGGLWALRQVPPEPLHFVLPFAVPLAWEEVLSTGPVEMAPEQDVLELTERTDLPCEGGIVVQLVVPASTRLPTAGELQRRIEAHLQGGTATKLPPEVVPIAPDASAALRAALGDLRRSLG
jgi:hypothetical protein